MTSDQFKTWRSRLNWSQVRAAKALGISVATLALYEKGRRFDNGVPVSIPKTVALACQLLELQITGDCTIYT